MRNKKNPFFHLAVALSVVAMVILVTPQLQAQDCPENMPFVIAGGIVVLTILVITIRHIVIIQYRAENAYVYLFEP